MSIASFRTVCYTAALLPLLLSPACAQIYHAAEMNTQEFTALDRAKTVIIIPGGILEEHGPFLPSYTDGYVANRLADEVADSLVEHGWAVVFFPPIPLGSGGANELAAKYPFSGTYTVRLNTLRAVYMDLADELGEAGFKWIFLVHTHGAPNHNRILDEAGNYFSETYSGRMVHLTGFGVPGGDDPRRNLSEKARQEDAGSGHAGIDETSEMLFLQPELVDPSYKKATAFPAGGNDGMVRVAKDKDWLGYFGAPQYSSAEYGAKLFRITATRMTQQALSILDGSTPQNIRRGPPRSLDEAAIARDRAHEQKQQEWLKKNGFE